MSRHVLFVVHGMGVADPVAWTGAVKTQIESLAQQYANDGFPVDYLKQNVVVVPIGYGDILTQKVREWQQQAGSISDFAKANHVDDHDVLDWLKSSDNKIQQFFWSHVSHVVLYRFFPLVREYVRVSVLRQLVEGIQKYYLHQSECRCSVLAHSLGTAVTHDCLHILSSRQSWRDPENGETIINPLQPNDFEFQSFFMVANVSRLLESDYDAYKSIVRPGPHIGKSSNCIEYYSIDHALDPIPLAKRFAPDTWPTAPNLLGLSHLRRWNIHELDHYLDHPKLHIPLLRTLTGDSSIPTAAAKREKAGYTQYEMDRVLQTEVQDIRAELEAVILKPADGQKLAGYFTALSEALDLINKLKAFLK